MAAQPPTDFRPYFSRLPKELQNMIWEEAVIMDHGGRNRILPLTQDTKRIVVIDGSWTRESSVFLACHEARKIALSLYSVVLPVVPFYGPYTTGNSLSELLLDGLLCDASPPQPLGRRFLRISPRTDLFLVTAQVNQFIINTTYGNLWTTLSPAGDPRFRAPVGRNWLPRLMTREVPPAVRASIERVIDHRDVWGTSSSLVQSEPIGASVNLEYLGTTGVIAEETSTGQPIHRFDRDEYSSARVCYHVENDVSSREAYRFERRLLGHLVQGYTSQQMLDWLNPVVCRL
ncbi:hypothetical protein PGQ11_006223 [Apiospora arundinis]|uniref:2EXR domain-containing protein n=1 Tax=Apiospora arundinis TaxID=335852 RepID=A0ABR2ISN1_9PEZI